MFRIRIVLPLDTQAGQLNQGAGPASDVGGAIAIGNNQPEIWTNLIILLL